jgi:hypothetical protein
MPIRFACPHCHQRLSVSTRKAATASQCPRCKASVTIPQAADESNSEASVPTDDLTGSFLVGEEMGAEGDIELAMEPSRQADEVQKVETEISSVASGSVPQRPALEKQPGESSTAVPRAGSGYVVVPRYVIYAQGGLLAAVAVASLVIGVLLGRSFAPRPAESDPARECNVSGSVTYTTGARTRPDRGAVIVMIPIMADAAGERAPVAGLRPSDPPPAAEHPGIGVIRQLGGSYTRADANGRFETSIPAGRYWRLIISHQKRARAAAQTGDVRTLGRYFENAADLLEDREHRLTQEAITGDVQWTIAFDGL